MEVEDPSVHPMEAREEDPEDNSRMAHRLEHSEARREAHLVDSIKDR